MLPTCRVKFLLLNQTFHPDVVATAQVLKDLALGLVEKGHEVTVLCGQRAYDTVGKSFSREERWKGIQIYRVPSFGFGKEAKWKRAIDFASFFLTSTFRALTLSKHDVVIALTSPPLISVLGALLARRWRASFFYWVMDLNPDAAIAAGWLKSNSLAAKLLDGISRFSLKRAKKIIVLDRFMKERVEAKGIDPAQIEVIPPWSHDDEVRFDSAGRERFRKAHGLQDKFVVMYSGNHSPCHPLDTLLDAAKQLGSTGDPPVPFGDSPKGSHDGSLGDEGRVASDASPANQILLSASTGERMKGEVSIPTGSTGGPPVAFGDSPKSSPLTTRHSTLDSSSIVFCFVGGGSEWRKIKESQCSPLPCSLPRGEGDSNEQIPNSKLQTPNFNILCLPYHPLNELAGSLSAADLHIVVMGEEFLGSIHPCKIYNILRIGSPVLFIGPRPSHVSEILETMDESCYGIASHGDTAEVVKQIRRFQQIQKPERDFQLFAATASRFSKQKLLPQLLRVLESSAK